MKTFAAWLLAALILLPSPALAGTPIFSNGYWFYPNDSTAYKRYVNWTWNAGYYSGCTYYPGYWSSYYSYAPVQLNAAAPDVELELIKIAGARDKAVLAIAAKAQKSASALALADKLGLSGNFGIPYYGSGLFPPYLSLSQVGSVGQTAYGGFGTYSFNQVTNVYDPLAKNAAFQQAAMLNKGSQDATSQGFALLMQFLNADASQQAALADKILAAQGRSATTLAAGKAAAEAINAAQPKGSTTTTNITGPAVPAPVGPPAEVKVPAVPVPAKLAASLSCLECHSAAKKSGGFDYESFDGLTASAEQLASVVKYLRSEDPKHRCPPGKPPLTPEQVNQVLSHQKGK